MTKPGRPKLTASERASTQIQLRVTRQRKSAYVRSAKKSGETLSSWAVGAMDAKSVYPVDSENNEQKR